MIGKEVRNFEKNMTLRQKISKWLYPLFVWYKKTSGESKKLESNGNVNPFVPFHSLYTVLNTGTKFSFEDLKGKKVLIVNTASNCGYTSQYAALQQLYEKYKEKVLVIGFPSNDFKQQEKGTDEEIAQFCHIHYSVTFPLAKKSVVIKSQDQNKVFEWLTHKELNGWNEQAPSWNFSKYLVNEKGTLIHYFDPAVSPFDPEVLKAINAK